MKLISIISSTVLALISTAFQLTIALYPHQLEPYARLVKYLWSLSVALGALWLVLKLMEKNEAAIPVPAAMPNINISPVFNQVASPVITQTTAVQQTRATKERQPSLVYVSTSQMRVHENFGALIDARSKGIEGNAATVAVIANRPAAGGKEVTPLYGIRAHIVYKNGDHEIHQGYGQWVGSFSNRVNFAAAESQKLVLVYEYGPMPGMVFGVVNPRNNDVPRHPFTAKRYVLEHAQPNNTVALTDQELDIEITLYDEGLVISVFNLKYERAEDGTYKITRV